MSVQQPARRHRRAAAFELRAPALEARTTRAAVADRRCSALAGLLAHGLLIVDLRGRHRQRCCRESVRPVPRDRLAGPFGSTGINLGSGGLIAVLLGLMFVSLRRRRRAPRDRLSARAVLTAHRGAERADPARPAAALDRHLQLPVLRPDGRAVRRQPVPRTARTRSRSTRCIPFIGAKWVDTPTVYGPVFTALSYLLAPLSIAASVLAYKAIAAVSSLGDRGAGLERGARCAASTRSGPRRWSGSTR